MRVASVLAALAVLAVAAPSAGAAVPDGLSGDGLERGTARAVPSVYRLDVVVRVRELRTRDGVVVPLPPDARRVAELGTAFGVAPGGWVVTAAHVAAPSGAALAAAAYQPVLAAGRAPHSDAAARAWVARTGARPVGVRVVSRRLRQADAGLGARRSREYAPTDIVVDRASDLALMRIDAPRAPSLPLDEAVSIGTPVTTIGFGSRAFATPDRGMLEPAMRRGALGRTGLLDDPTDPTGETRRRAVQVTTPVLPGDSGGPAVDAHGRARGVVVKFSDTGGVIERASEVRMLLRRAGVSAAADPTAGGFGEALESYWRLDLTAAEAGFRRTLTRFPEHTLAPVLLDRTERIEAAVPLIRADGGRRRSFLLALGLVSAVAAAGCAAGLLLGLRPDGGPPAGAPRRVDAERRR